jgi:hypothetical protein
MSEPNSGSDLFAARTLSTKTDGGWLINGTKIWTSNAHQADYMIGLFRTSSSTKENRRHGLTQFLVDMKTPGISVNPVYQLTSQHDFNEVVFQDAFMPDDHVLGEIDGAWKQATSELAYERSGPERFLETYYVLTELVRALGSNPDARGAEGNPNFIFVWDLRSAHFNIVEVAGQEIRIVLKRARKILDHRNFVRPALSVLQSEPQMIRDQIFECIQRSVM